MKTLSFWKKPVYSALIFCGTVTALTIGYSSYISSLPAVVGSGSGLTATEWNKMVSGLQTLDTNLSNLSFNGGNVGIGVNPGAKLHISNTAGVSIQIDKPTGASIQFSRNGTSGYQIDDNAGSIRFLSSGTEKVRIDPSGNVGIGTSSPQTWAKLDINGNVNISGSIYGQGPTQIAGKAWCAALSSSNSKGYSEVIPIDGSTVACSTQCTTSGYAGCLGSVDFNHGDTIGHETGTTYTGDGCSGVYVSRDYCCCWH